MTNEDMNYFDQTSERLIYRRLTLEDIPGWTDFFENNDRLKYLGTVAGKSKEQAAKDWVERQLDRYSRNEFGHLAVIHKESGHFIGMCGILIRDINDRIEYEIGYSVKPTYWGFGYATEMAKTMKLFGFNHIQTNRLISIIHIDNHDSVKVAIKNGMDKLYKTKFMDMEVNVYGIPNPDL